MKYLYFIIVTVLFVFISFWYLGAKLINTTTQQAPDQHLLQLSGSLIYAVKSEASTDSIEKQLAALQTNQLITGLSNDNARITFWVNMYNAWYQILAGKHHKKQPAIYTEKAINIAGHLFSLDDIEHGILRKYRGKYSLGYLPQFLPLKLIRQLAVTKLDYRIHFALNCGAKSCPPIAFYTYESIGKQLDMAALSFLSSDTEINDTEKVLQVTSIMKWFLADFGGKKGIKEILKKNLNKDFSSYKVRFKKYDWSTDLKNYAVQE